MTVKNFEVYSNFVSPVSFEKSENGNIAKFTISPLERGYGVTLGNSLRRVLLSSIRGVCVSAIEIDNISHEFSSIDGVLEDVLNLSLNFKDLVLKMDKANYNEIEIEVSGPAKIYGKDIAAQLNSLDIQIVNPDIYLFEITAPRKIKLKLHISAGFGTETLSFSQIKSASTGKISINRNFTPVKNVSFEVKQVRHNEFTDYDQLVLNVETNGSLSPVDAVAHGATVMRNMLANFINFDENVLNCHIKDNKGSNALSHSGDSQRNVMDMQLSEFELSVRTWNCMKEMGLNSVSQLALKTERDLLKQKNFGRKSLNEIKDLLNKHGLTLAKDSISDDF